MKNDASYDEIINNFQNIIVVTPRTTNELNNLLREEDKNIEEIKKKLNILVQNKNDLDVMTKTLKKMSDDEKGDKRTHLNNLSNTYQNFGEKINREITHYDKIFEKIEDDEKKKQLLKSNVQTQQQVQPQVQPQVQQRQVQLPIKQQPQLQQQTYQQVYQQTRNNSLKQQLQINTLKQQSLIKETLNNESMINSKNISKYDIPWNTRSLTDYDLNKDENIQIIMTKYYKTNVFYDLKNTKNEWIINKNVLKKEFVYKILKKIIKTNNIKWWDLKKNIQIIEMIKQHIIKKLIKASNKQ